jgi:hypothetical protein
MNLFRPGSSAIALPLVLMAVVLSGCAASQPQPYKDEEFSAANTYAHSYAAQGSATCAAAWRALLSQGYIVTDATASLVKGSKSFQRSDDRHAVVQFTIVCAPDSAGSNTTTVFANAVRETYSLKKSSTSASVGVGILGSLSVPFGSSDDSLVKVAVETISNKRFYALFFDRIEGYLDVLEGKEDVKRPPATTDAADAVESIDKTDQTDQTGGEFSR